MMGRYLSIVAIALTCAGCSVAGVTAGQLTQEDLAFLSFQVSEKVELEPALIGQIQRDIAAIARQEPRVRDVDPRPPFKPRELLLEVSEATAESIEAGEYDAWSDLHAKLLVNSVRVDGRRVSIDYGETYNIPQLARRYEGLPGVLTASPTRIIGDGSWIYIQRRKGQWHYIIDIAWGDCIAGCAERRLFYFVVDANGAVRGKDHWSSPNTSEPPAWVEEWRQLHRAR